MIFEASPFGDRISCRGRSTSVYGFFATFGVRQQCLITLWTPQLI
ncbi:MAG: hypothetical protein AAGE84_29465 [Cyanobacteria bacterium P01_G01_bin.39]